MFKALIDNFEKSGYTRKEVRTAIRCLKMHKKLIVFGDPYYQIHNTRHGKVKPTVLSAHIIVTWSEKANTLYEVDETNMEIRLKDVFLLDCQKRDDHVFLK